MITTMEGTEVQPIRVDVKPVGKPFVMAADLASLPKDTPLEAIRRVLAVRQGQILQYVSDFLTSDGQIDRRSSKVVVINTAGEWNALQSVGRVDSPVAFQVLDVSP